MTSKTGITVAQENPKSKSHPVDEVTFLPCSFCNIVISSNILEMHEVDNNFLLLNLYIIILNFVTI